MALKTVITGIAGRMGQALVRAVESSGSLVLHAGTERAGNSLVGASLSSGAKVFDALGPALTGADVVIDFSSVEASLEHARICAQGRIPLVIGSTGFDDATRAQLSTAAKQVPIVLSPNMSIGVNLMIEFAAQLAKRVGEGFDIEVLETHHRMKKDAPSGTAVRLAEEIAKATHRGSEDIRQARVGMVGARPPKEIGVQALRGGDVVGEHTVFYFGDGERLELTHRATSRDQFARGALRAAQWVVNQPPGLYGMPQVLAEPG